MLNSNPIARVGGIFVAQIPSQQDKVCFGAYEIHLPTQEIFKHGSRVKLPPQAFRVLQTLLDRPGQLVTREEFHRALWPADTFVDFDHGLNNAIKKIRDILSDSADAPRYIQTLPKLGYRFIGQIDGASHASTVEPRPSGEPDNENGVLSHGSRSLELAVQPPAVTEDKGNRRTLAWLLGITAVVLLGAAVLLYVKPALSPKVTGSTQLTSGNDPRYIIVTDGPRLFFRVNRPEGGAIAEMSTAGGDISILPTPTSDPAIYDISPDHSHLLLTQTTQAAAQIWNMPLPVGAPQKIGDMDVGGASWFPDGQHLLLLGKGVFYVANPDGSGLRRFLTGLPKGIIFWGYFSPDGSRLRFSVLNDETAMISIWEARSDGSNLHPLFPEWHSGKGVCCGRWTADGKYYVFVAVTNIGNVSGDLFALAEQIPLFRKSSREPVRLTFGPLAFAAPLPSLNGKQLFAFGLRQRGEIVRYDSSSNQFVPFLGGISATNVSFSRDGKWIAFVSLPDNHLWRGRADGSDRLQLTFGDSVSGLPRWSPDGKQIAYVSSSGGKPWKISMISADGGLPRALFPDSGGESDPTWSPDGKQIAFATDFGGHFHIRVLDLQSGDISSIPAPAEVFSPRWSPDGRYIAALLHDYPYKELFLFDVHTRKWSEWTSDNDGISWPAWTADSRYLQYQTMSGEHTVRRIRVGETSAATLFSAKGLRTIPGPFSSWSDNAHDDSRMFTRDNWGQEIYALDLDFP